MARRLIALVESLLFLAKVLIVFLAWELELSIIWALVLITVFTLIRISISARIIQLTIGEANSHQRSRLDVASLRERTKEVIEGKLVL